MKFYVEFHSETGVWTGTLNFCASVARRKHSRPVITSNLGYKMMNLKGPKT